VAGPILVTGAHGFVGRHLLAELGERARPLEADVTDRSALTAEVARYEPDAVVHLAALSSVADSWEDAAETWRVNVLGTVNVLEAAFDTRVLVASTSEVYGRADEIPTTESAPVKPVSPYAASKAAAELAANQAREAGADIVVVRPFQHEGPGRDERFAVGSWAAQIAEGGGTIRVGDLSARRDITDVRDVCRAYALLLDRSVPADTYNIATGNAVEMREVLETLIGLAPVPIEIEDDPARARPADVPVLCGDASRLRSATGWEPTIPLDKTLADTLAAAREQKEKMANA
jgi:GDP-4-dehydro-6-deoxy-D-mannose reductase